MKHKSLILVAAMSLSAPGLVHADQVSTDQVKKPYPNKMAHFDEADTDKDGVLSRNEFYQYKKALREEMRVRHMERKPHVERDYRHKKAHKPWKESE